MYHVYKLTGSSSPPPYLKSSVVHSVEHVAGVRVAPTADQLVEIGMRPEICINVAASYYLV